MGNNKTKLCSGPASRVHIVNVARMDTSEYMEKMRKEMEGSNSYMETEWDQTELA